jgi:hypothetical protein
MCEEELEEVSAMRGNKWLLFWGLAFILAGAVMFWDNLDIGPNIPFGPLALIALGVYVLLRSTRWSGRSSLAQSAANRLFGTVRLNQPGWQPTNDDIFTIIGDVRIDLRQAVIPDGETTLRVRCIIGDIRILVPIGIGVSASASGIIGDQRILDQRRDGLFVDLAVTSPDYATATRKVRIEASYVIGDVSIGYV